MQRSLLVLILMGECSYCLDRLCEYHFVTEKRSWEDAQGYCKDNYTDLATVYDMEDVKTLVDLLESESAAWIGLREQSNAMRTWHWSLPREKFNDSETKWKQGEPDNSVAPENCAATLNGEWLDIICTRPLEFICYDDAKPKHFHLIEEPKNWHEAQTFCRENHTDLVSGLEQQKNPEFISLSTTDKQQWIGLFRDTWKWSDGSHFSFRHWDQIPEERRDGDEQLNCATQTSGKWSSKDCRGENHFFCYDDMVILIKMNKTWEEALDYCREHHRNLASVTSHRLQAWVERRAGQADTAFVWVGLRYTCTLGFWFWVTDEAVEYENWNSEGKRDECDMSGAVETGAGHKWFKKSARSEFNFLCLRS
ncbi:macrophage mannose receptor 1-like isoform 2-T2 [Spinachia spinachia]